MLVIIRLQRTNRSPGPGPGPQPAGRNSPGNAVTSMVSIDLVLPAVLFVCFLVWTLKLLLWLMLCFFCFFLFKLQLSPSFTPTSVIRKMYATKDKSRDEPSSRPDTKEEASVHTQDGRALNYRRLLDMRPCPSTAAL